MQQFAKLFVAAASGAHDLLNPSVVQNFIEPTTPAPQIPTDRVLGWITPTFPNSSAGTHFSRHSIGHTGFTGCSLWIDLEKKLWVILLTNRTHPTVENNKIRTFRPMIHDLILVEVGLFHPV
jgi:CubicO group peptidase (beta-lactamase class C family)